MRTLRVPQNLKLITTLHQCGNANEFRHARVRASALTHLYFHTHLVSAGIF